MTGKEFGNMSTCTTATPAPARGQAKGYPRVSRVDGLAPGGCLFHVTNGAEAYRVERLGGEPEFTRMILDEPRPGEVLFDVGACIGLISIHAAKRGARVVSFEPEPQFRARFRENLHLNDLVDHVQLIDWAVSDAPGEVQLYTDGVAGLSPSLSCVGDRGAVRVATDSIDAVLDRGEISAPQVVKLDVEGAETLALRGMRRLLNGPAAPRALFIELHPKFLPGFGSSVDEASSLLTSAGYAIAYDAGRADQIHRVYRK
jgi:FkbM family methyltransferase